MGAKTTVPIVTFDATVHPKEKLMARIIGGIGASHSPTIGYAKDHRKQDDPVWKPIFDGFSAIRTWVRDQNVDVIFLIYNDHITSFFFDHYSAFVLGIDESYAAADEGGGPRKVAPARGHLALSQHIATSLMADEFDMSFFQGKPVDHGMLSPLSMLGEGDAPWPGQVVPLQVGVLQLPLPSARRMWKLGQALRRAIESYPEDLRYHREHDWVRADGDEAIFGITWHAQDALGEVVYFEPPAVGSHIDADSSYGSLESVKAVSDVIAPLSGTVTAVNDKVVETPELVNESPYADGWLIRVKLDDAGSVENLLDADAYQALL